jgi:hypothetical protein
MTARRRPSARRRALSGQRRDDWQVYALAAGSFPPTIRVGRHRIRALKVGPVAVLGATPAADATFTEAALREQHAIVLGLAEAIDPLLPVRFGTRMSADHLQSTILRSLAVLTNALENVRGRRQMTLRLIGVPMVDEPPAAGGSGSTYLQQRRAAYAVPSELEPVRAAVTRFVVEERLSPGRAGVRSTVFHLVDRGAVDSYREAVQRAAEAMPAGSVTISGPWPPFAFAPELPG